MATLALAGDGPGKGRSVNVTALASRTLTMAVYNFAFDSSYPTGGEDISAIWSDFRVVVGVWATQNDATLADVRLPVVDLTNKKLLLVTTLAVGANVEAGSASNQTAVGDVQLLVVGYK